MIVLNHHKCEEPPLTSTPRMASRNQWQPGLPVLTGLSYVSMLRRSQYGPLCDPRGQSAPTVED